MPGPAPGPLTSMATGRAARPACTTDSRLVRDRLRELLRQRGWTQSELARRLGKHRVWVHYRIKGATGIKADEIPLLAAALGVPAHAFFERAPSEQSAPTLAEDPLDEAEREFVLGLLELLDRYRRRTAAVPGSRSGARLQILRLSRAIAEP